MLHKDPDKPAPESKPAPLPGKSPEELTRQLRESVRRKRPWKLAGLVLWLVVICIPFAAMVWWFWPKPDPPRLVVIGFDQIAVTGKPTAVRAATYLFDGKGRIDGQELFFREANAGAPQTKAVNLRTDKNGIATMDWTAGSAQGVTEFDVSYVADKARPPWFDRGRSRVYIWPPDSKLLLLDVVPTLDDASDPIGLKNALDQAQAAGWGVVYLALKSNSAVEYRKVRDSVLGRQSQKGSYVPSGPVLARPQFFDGKDESQVRKKLFGNIKALFARQVVYLTDTAKMTLHIIAEDGGFVGEAARIEDWSKLLRTLPE